MMEEENVDGDDTGDSDGYKDDTDLTITMPLNSVSGILIKYQGLRRRRVAQPRLSRYHE